MRRLVRFSCQAVAYAAFAVTIGYLSRSPAYEYAAPGRAVIKVSMSHATDRVKPCIQLSPQDIARLAPNMRRDMQCERKRLPLVMELEVDGETRLHVEAPPSGLWGDGPASVYQTLDVDPGRHLVRARLRDSERDEGWDYSHEEPVILEAGRYFTVTFRPETGGFQFR